MPNSYRPRQDGADSYRPRREPPPPPPPPSRLFRPPPPPPPPPLPLSPPPPPMHYFAGGDSYRPPPPWSADTYRPNNAGRYGNDSLTGPPRYGNHLDGFSFRSRVEAPEFTSSIPTQPAANRRNHHRPGRNGEGFQRGRPVRRHILPASERPILRAGRRSSTPEQMIGMSDGRSKFLDPDTLSQGDTDMDFDSEDSDIERGGDSEDEYVPEPSRKKARTAVVGPEDSSVPKWSNPDPYTVLPPPGETQAKKKDVVGMIRTAKAPREQAGKQSNAVADNDDFISLDFNNPADDTSDDESSSDTSLSEEPTKNNVELRNRAGRSTFSHLSSLHPDRHVRKDEGNMSRDDDDNEISTRSSTQQAQASIRDVKPTHFNAVESDYWSNKREVGHAKLPPLRDIGASKKRKREELDGTVLYEWRPYKYEDPTPWCESDRYQTEDVSRWLHYEILDFYSYTRPQSFESRVRQELIERISYRLKRHYPGSELLPFGSYAAGIYLPTADMDLVLLSKEFLLNGRKTLGQDRGSLYRIKSQLEKAGIARPGVEVIFSAKVPIIKFVDVPTGLKVDMSFENTTGIIANDTFKAWKIQYPAMPMIVALVKQFLHMRGLDEVFTGGLGGFTVTCLVTSLLQNWPPSQSGNFDLANNLGQFLLYFFNFYGNKFNVENVTISMNPPGYLEKYVRDVRKLDRLSIIDPNRSDNDISQGSHKVGLVLRCFAEAHEDLVDWMDELDRRGVDERRGASILGRILAGDYVHFDKQRRHLRRLDEGRCYEQSDIDDSDHSDYSDHSDSSEASQCPDLDEVMLDLSELPTREKSYARP